MRHNDRVLGRRKANIPFGFQLTTTTVVRRSVLSERTKLDARSITPGCSRNEVRIRGAVGYSVTMEIEGY